MSRRPAIDPTEISDDPRAAFIDPRDLDAIGHTLRTNPGLMSGLMRKVDQMGIERARHLPGSRIGPAEPDTPRQRVAQALAGDNPGSERANFTRGLLGTDGYTSDPSPGPLGLGLYDVAKMAGYATPLRGLSTVLDGAETIADPSSLHPLDVVLMAGGIRNPDVRNTVRAAATGYAGYHSDPAHTGESYHDAGDVDGYAKGGSVKPGTVSKLFAAALAAGSTLSGGMTHGPDHVLQGADRPGMISPRLPTAVKATENPFEDYLDVNTAAMKRDPEMYEHNMNVVRQYPVIPEEVARDGTADDVADAYRDVFKRNLLFLHDKMPADQRERSQKWYDGANAIIRRRAQEFGIPDPAVAGVYAALSPQKDWFQNVSLGDRVMSILNRTGNTSFDNKMARTARSLFANPADRLVIRNLMGRRLSDLHDPVEKALWLRAYDQTYNSPAYKVISPEGHYLDTMLTNKGDPARAAWGSLNEIAKAIASAQSGGDMDLISQLMGERHKVRSFFDNMIAPMSRTGAITGDTHAVAAGQLRPLSGNSDAVAHNFKNGLAKGKQPDDWMAAKGSAVTGVQGTYGLNADGYRDAAAEAGILPRQMQSITWEGVRGLFTPTFKADPRNLAATDAIWNEFRHGRMSQEEAQHRIYELAGGMKAPDWHDMADTGE